MTGWKSPGRSLAMDQQLSLAPGMCPALSSTANVNQTLNEKRLSKSSAGQNAFSASRSITMLSLPPENIRHGFSNSAATSRKM